MFSRAVQDPGSALCLSGTVCLSCHCALLQGPMAVPMVSPFTSTSSMDGAELAPAPASPPSVDESTDDEDETTVVVEATKVCLLGSGWQVAGMEPDWDASCPLRCNRFCCTDGAAQQHFTSAHVRWQVDLAGLAAAACDADVLTVKAARHALPACRWASCGGDAM